MRGLLFLVALCAASPLLKFHKGDLQFHQLMSHVSSEGQLGGHPSLHVTDRIPSPLVAATLGYIPDGAYVVFVNSSSAYSSLVSQHNGAVTALPAWAKQHPALASSNSIHALDLFFPPFAPPCPTSTIASLQEMSCPANLTAVYGDARLRISFPFAAAPLCVAAAASFPSLRFLSPVPTVHTASLFDLAQLDLVPAQYVFDPPPPPPPTSPPLAIPFRGAGQIVGLGDSGLDAALCYFHDPTRPVPFGAPDFSHRKIVLYDPVADDSDEGGGHGTRTASILAGAAALPTGRVPSWRDAAFYNGVAPDARIAFVDMKRGGDDSWRLVHDDLAAAYYPRMAAVGARVVSSSWNAYVVNNEYNAGQLPPPPL
jgi:hypothetical protein